MSSAPEAARQFRPDIEGLRAIAVLAVVLGHAGAPGFSSGHLGVDIFFVISGYLITGTMLHDRARGRFSLAAFWERRARRILPALLVVLAACSPVAMLVLLYEPLEDFGQSLFVTVLFSNNVLLTVTSGYWAEDAAFKPLLHTWSLGVEEQFYLVYPLLFAALAGRGRSLAAVLLLVFAASLPAGLLLSDAHPDGVFYLLPTRAWELAAGGLVALAALPRSPWLAACGLALLAAALFIVPGGEAFPSFAAIAAVGGTALVLGSGSGPAAQLLALPPLVAIGSWSYAIYLWHQPLLAFQRVLSRAEPTFAAFLPALIATVVLGWATTRFVERFWRDRNQVPVRRLLVAVGSGGALIAALGLLLHLAHGLPERHFPGADLTDHVAYNERVRALAEIGPGARSPILVVGNSRARDFVNVLIEGGAQRQHALAYLEDDEPCRAGFADLPLVRSARTLVIEGGPFTDGCLARFRSLQAAGTRLIVLGPRQFGYSLEAWLGTPPSQRSALRVPPLPGYLEENARLRCQLPPGSYIDWFALFTPDASGLPLFGPRGLPVTADRVHLTREGARLFADRLRRQPEFAGLFD